MEGKRFSRILVTGGAGYVGTSLVPALLGKGYQVRVFDVLRHGGDGLLHFFKDRNFEFVKGDIRDKKAVEKAVEGVDVVIHLAAIVGFPACKKEPEVSREINVGGTKNLVEAARGRIPIIFASTGSTYGHLKEDLCTENTPVNPLSDYGRHKVESEEIISKGASGQFVIYRFATAFGVSPRMRLDLLPNDFTYRAVKERSLILYEKTFLRTFIHVRDMARSFVFALENYDKMKGEIYNVGDNSMNCSKEDLAKMIRNKVDYYLHFADVGHDIDQRDYMVSYEKIGNLGFRTTVSLQEGIDELIKAAEVLEAKNPYSNV